MWYIDGRNGTSTSRMEDAPTSALLVSIESFVACCTTLSSDQSHSLHGILSTYRGRYGGGLLHTFSY